MEFPESAQILPESVPAEIPFKIAVFTNDVVAICVVFVPDAAVGAVGVPERAGEARSALLRFKSSSCHWRLLDALSRYPSSVVEILDDASSFPAKSETTTRLGVRFPVRYGEIAPESDAHTRAFV